ncbi:hypothetical protein PG997_000635 [Apiospora hydei]|uniref:GED domain-containing protein n=1 Tax=Apiospora hydei TaxID=1337664 RepID=A0ABR1XB85_9PEZI
MRGRNPFGTEAAILAAYIDGQWIRGELCREDSLSDGPFVAIINERLTKSRNGTAGGQTSSLLALRARHRQGSSGPSLPGTAVAKRLAVTGPELFAHAQARIKLLFERPLINNMVARYCAMSASLKELGDELDKFPEIVDLTDRDIQKHATELIIRMDKVRKAVLQLSLTEVKRVC